MPAPKNSVVSNTAAVETFASLLPKFKPVPMTHDDCDRVIRSDLIDFMVTFPEFDFNGEGDLQVDNVNGNSSIVVAGHVLDGDDDDDGNIAYTASFIKYNPEKKWESPAFDTPRAAFDALVQKLNAPKAAAGEAPKRGPGRPRKATS